MKPQHRAWSFIALLAGMVTLQFVLSASSMYVLSGVRAYVAGESLYSKGQKDAQIFFMAYLESRQEADYEGLVRSLAVPLADGRAREAMQADPPDLDLARRAFLEGANAPDDIGAMIRVFRWFGDTPLMSEPIAIWTEGDAAVQAMRRLARRAHEQIAAGPVDDAALAAIHAEARRQNARLTELERRFSDRLGAAARQARNLLLAVNALVAAGLALAGFAFVMRTSRTQARSELVMERLVGAVTDGVITFGRDRRIKVFNAAAEAQFRIAAQDALGSSVDRLFVTAVAAPDDDSGAGSLHALVARRPDGSRFHVESTFSRIRSAEDVLTTIVLRDVTERELARAEREAREALEASSRAKTEFLSRMSHELRTPLNAVIGFAHLLRVDSGQPPTPVQLERIRHIERAGNLLLALVNDILDLSRIDAGEMAVTTESVEVAVAADEAATMVSPLVTRTGVELIVNPGRPDRRSAQPVWVSADPVRLRQVLVNLLSNGVKYNRPGGTAALSWAVTDGHCEIRVVDDGMGMSAAQLERLFEPFNRLGAERSRVEGTGIGLVLSRQLTELMGGTLQISSTPGAGTQATVRLRLAAPMTPAAAVERPDLDLEPASGWLNLLYAEDDEVNAALVRQLLADRSEITLRIASNGSEALAIAREWLPDLILVDMNLGDMTGLELAAALRDDNETRDIELVALSADALPEQIDAAMRQGFREYLTKPVNFARLLDLLDDRLRLPT